MNEVEGLMPRMLTPTERQALLELIGPRTVVASTSGGKDSAAMSLWLTELGIPHRRVFQDTGWEHPLSYHYILRRTDARAAILNVRPMWDEERVDRFLDQQDAQFGGDAPLQRALGPIEVIRGDLQMADLIRSKGMFPSRTRRFCTEQLKVEPMAKFLAGLMEAGVGVVNAIGIRHGESTARALTPEWDFSGLFKCEVWAPLTTWSLDDVIEIHRRHQLHPNPLYLLGASRVGCWPCIFARKAEIRLMAESDPDQVAIMRWLEAEIAEKARARYERDRAAWLIEPDPEPLVPSVPDDAFYASQWAPRHRWEAKRDRLMRPFRAPAFFQAQRKDDDGTYPMLPIDAAVAWSRTAFGGRQFEMFAPTSADTGCVRWGLCDTGTPAEDQP